jgi:hypothetical protein
MMISIDWTFNTFQHHLTPPFVYKAIRNGKEENQTDIND